MVLGAALVGDYVGNAVQQVGVPGRAQANRLREDCRQPGTRHPMQGFIPPVILRDVQALDARGIVHHLTDFFLQRHLRHEVVDSCLDAGWLG